MLLWLRNLNFAGGVVVITSFGKLLLVPQGTVKLTVDPGRVTVVVLED